MKKILLDVDAVGTHVILLEEEKEIDRVRIEPNRELLERILPAIDILLSRHNTIPQSITDVYVKSDLPDGYSSRRIAETIAMTWMFARRE